MSDLEDLGKLLKTVNAAQFSNRSVNKTQKTTIIEHTETIDNLMAEACLKLKNVEELMSSKATEVRSAVRAIHQHNGKTHGSIVSFRDAL